MEAALSNKGALCVRVGKGRKQGGCFREGRNRLIVEGVKEGGLGRADQRFYQTSQREDTEQGPANTPRPVCKLTHIGNHSQPNLAPRLIVCLPTCRPVITVFLGIATVIWCDCRDHWLYWWCPPSSKGDLLSILTTTPPDTLI